MKLASLKNGRDGQLIVVSKDLSKYLVAADAAPTLQAALDNWDRVQPQLAALAEQVESNGESFDQTACASPLPRAYQSVSYTHLTLPTTSRV